jgi:hypothetical protein
MDWHEREFRRRELLQRLGVATGAVWATPVLDSVVAPAFAGTPPPTTNTTTSTSTSTTSTSSTTSTTAPCVPTPIGVIVCPILIQVRAQVIAVFNALIAQFPQLAALLIALRDQIVAAIDAQIAQFGCCL